MGLCSSQSQKDLVLVPDAMIQQRQHPEHVRTTDKHLICDDSSYNRLVLRRFLESLKIECMEAESAEEVFDLVRDNGVFALIWMDQRFAPEAMTGIECARKLRAQDYEGVIIALSGFLDQQTFLACKEVGMQQFLSKPFYRSAVATYARRYRHKSSLTAPKNTTAPSSEN